VKLPAFGYHRAESLADATAALAEYGADARVLGGGQSLLPLMAMRMSSPDVLVDITAAADLHGHRADPGAGLAIPAAVTMRTVERDPEVARVHPLVRACLAMVGHAEIRSRGTVCGSLAHADPAAELPALLLAIDGSVELASVAGPRRVEARDFVLGPYTTAVGDGELVAGVTLPALSPTAGWSILEIARRAGDFALVGVIAVLDLDADGRCVDARIALFGAAATPWRAVAAEAALRGAGTDADSLREAAERAFDEVDVLGDLHGSATYRRRAGIRLVERALREARSRCAPTPLEAARA
jgi:aerobic carbon-monoxide dehydrogenase medium subunit